MGTLLDIALATYLVSSLVFVVLIIVVGAYKLSSKGQRAGDRRASELLRAVLTREQYGQLIRHGYVNIPSPGDPQFTYRVPQAPGRVGLRVNGRNTASLCLRPVEQVPDADIVVIHKLMIEADEETYLRKANRLAV